MSIIAILALFVLLPTAGLFHMKHADQTKRDRQRKSYKLSFPSQLEADSVTAWLRSISGTLRSKGSFFDGLPTVAFEVWSTPSGIEHHLKVPWQYADYVVSQLLALVPGMRVTPDEDFPRRLWTTGLELGIKSRHQQLRIHSATNTSVTLLAAMQPLESGEAVLMQWVITPAIPVRLPNEAELKLSRDEVNDRRAKLSEPNVMAVLRVMTVAETEPRAAHLLYRIRAALAATRSPHAKFVKRLVTKDGLQKRVDRVSTPLSFPMQLSAPELTALLAWPIESAYVAGLPPRLARQLPTPQNVPSTGRIIGRSNMPGNERPVAVSYADAVKHMHVVAPTGAGKSVLLGNMLKQDIEQGYGAIVIETKGDLFYKALNYVPWERLDDVIVLDVNDRNYPVGFNVLGQGDPRVVVEELGALFDHLYSSSPSVWTKEVLYHGLQTLVTDASLTFADLSPLLVPMTPDEIEWSDRLKRNVKDRDIRQFWQRHDNKPRPEQDRITQPVMDRIWQLNARPELRHIIGQSQSSFGMADVVTGNKVLLVNLAGLPKDTASLTATLLINALWHAVKNNRPEKPNFLYLDEVQTLTAIPVDPEEMLAQARSFGLGITLAHQHLAQLPTALRSGIMANARTKLAFQLTSDDAKAMQREFGAAVSDDDFMHLGRYEALVRVATGDGVSTPLTLAALPPATGYNYSRELVARSRELYGRPVAEVEKAIQERRVEAKLDKGRRPPISSLDIPPEMLAPEA